MAEVLLLLANEMEKCNARVLLAYLIRQALWLQHTTRQCPWASQQCALSVLEMTMSWPVSQTPVPAHSSRSGREESADVSKCTTERMLKILSLPLNIHKTYIKVVDNELFWSHFSSYLQIHFTNTCMFKCKHRIQPFRRKLSRLTSLSPLWCVITASRIVTDTREACMMLATSSLLVREATAEHAASKAPACATDLATSDATSSAAPELTT